MTKLTLIEEAKILQEIPLQKLTNMPVSKLNIFRDDIWSFVGEELPRYNAINDSKLIINWLEYSEVLGRELIQDVKVLAYVYLKFPTLFARFSWVHDMGYKPNTVSENIKRLLNFFKSLSDYWKHEVGTDRVPYYLNLSEITFFEIQSYAELNEVKSGQVVKSLLSNLTAKEVKRLLKFPPTWNAVDINNLSFFSQRNERENKGALKDDLFSFLTNKATNDVLTFLINMEYNPITKEYEVKLVDNNLFTSIDFRSAFEDYCNLRKKVKGYKVKDIDWIKFKKRYKISAGEFGKICYRVQLASIYLIVQFTGVRYSEGASFDIDSLKNEDDICLLKGTVIKHQPLEKETMKDDWVAIPIVQDSFKVLQLCSCYTMNKFILSGFETVRPNKVGKPFSNGGLNGCLNNYKNLVDEENLYINNKEYELTVHRLRHTLTKHMVRAKLNLPYISFHLKHVKHAYEFYKEINNVTFSYGNAGSELLSNITAIKDAQRELVRNVYDPDSVVIGQMKEEFQNRRKKFFEGMMEYGWEKEEILDYITVHGFPLVDVGAGYCGNSLDLNDKKASSLPCMGQLRCNPAKCPQAIITTSHKDIWLSIYKQNLSMRDNPEFSHLSEYFKEIIKDAENVLKDLNVDISSV